MRRRFHTKSFTLMLIVCFWAVLGHAAPVVPFDADLFVDSIGVNTQLGGNSPGYASYGKIKSALKTLGIRHIRNPLWGNPPPYASFNDLSSAGIRLIVPTGYNHDGQGVAMLISQFRNISGAVEGVEGVNEPDIFSRQVSAQQLFTYQKELFLHIKLDATLKNIPVLALSLGNPYSNNLGQQLADLGIGQYADCANSHAYPSSWMPENHSWVANMITWANTVTPGKAQIMTETGYGYGQPDSAASIYTPRLLLDLICARKLKRIYIYQLADIGDGFGGLYQSDGSTINAQGRSVKNLINMLREESDISTVPIPLNFALSGDLSSLKTQLLQQKDGNYFLALWRAYEATNTSASNVVLTLNHDFRLTTAVKYTDLDSATFNPLGTVLAFTNRDESILVGTRIVMIKLAGKSAPPSATSIDPNLYE